MDWSEIFRPRKWDDVLGQEHLKPVLYPSLLNHTFPKISMFTGPSGTGKSTIAELCAMAIACENSDVEPCCNCKSCKDFINGNSLIIKKYNMAKLLQKSDAVDVVHKIFDYESISGKSVFILEEIHELSSSAQAPFLEEMTRIPDDVYIIMCTTKPYSVITEMRSRAVQFQCEVPTLTQCREYIKSICSRAGMRAPSGNALDILINTCERNPRGIIKTLQLFSSADKITPELLIDFYGLTPNLIYVDLLEKLLKSCSYSEYCMFIASIDEQGYSAQKVLKGFSSFMVDVLLLRSGGKIKLIDKDKRLPQILDELGEAGVLKIMNFMKDINYHSYSDDSNAKFNLLLLKLEFTQSVNNNINSATVTQIEAEKRSREIAKHNQTTANLKSLQNLSSSQLHQSGSNFFKED